jgi:hypothetical protein
MRTDHEIIMEHMHKIGDERRDYTRRMINEKFTKVSEDVWEWAGLRMNHEGCEAYIHWMLTEYGDKMLPDLDSDDLTTPLPFMRFPIIETIAR